MDSPPHSRPLRGDPPDRRNLGSAPEIPPELRWRLLQTQTRRHFLRRCQSGLGAIALAAAAGSRAAASTSAEDHGQPPIPRHPARAKRVIYLHMAGSPPQHDLFDHKPELKRFDRKPCPEEFIEGRRLAFIKGRPVLLGSPYEFRRVGESGRWLSEKLVHFERVADKVCMVHSMSTDQFNHAPAQLLLYTGFPQFGHASMGSWVTYGLGSENEDLPGYVVLISGGTDPSGGKSLWGSGFLPSVYQGVQCRSGGDPVLYVQDPPGLSRSSRRRGLDALDQLHRFELEQVGDPEVLTRIEQSELAFRMQMSVPDAMDLRRESPATLDQYGAEPGATSFANNCLLARRLVERGVRFVQLYDWGWDIHGTGTHDDLLTQFPMKCEETDRPIAALLEDLEQRGLLDETLVVWSGEFGRTSMNEARGGSTYLGRDHHPDCFTIWLAGGGVKPGVTYGATDELGYTVVEDPVNVRDLQATILHLLGLDPEHFRYRHLGLDHRLIGPSHGPRVVEEWLL